MSPSTALTYLSSLNLSQFQQHERAKVNRVCVPTEFLKMMTTETKGVDLEQEMRSAFKVFDVDGSGTISPDEIFRLMSSFGEKLSEEEIKSMVKEVDSNGDGSIDCEFASCLTELRAMLI